MTSLTASLGRDQFAEFYAEWHPRTVNAARKRGLADPEDVASDIMLVFLEKDYLDRFDPTLKDDGVTFESWVNSILYWRLNNASRDEHRRPMGHTIEHTIELSGHDVPISEQPMAEFKLLAMSCFELLRDRYGIELAEVWVSVVKQVITDSTNTSGYVRQWLAAKHLGIPSVVIGRRLNELRRVILADNELREMLGADHWAHAAA